jgi:hypothetical protein
MLNTVRVLPSTRTSETWLIWAKGCPGFWKNITFHESETCESSRGFFYSHNNNTRLFTKPPSASTSANISNLEVFHDYGVTNMKAHYVSDNIQLGFKNINQATVGAIIDSNFTWLGLLGLDHQPYNFSIPMDMFSENNTQGLSDPNVANKLIQNPSLLQQMKTEGIIPSLSWAYHAGSHGC